MSSMTTNATVMTAENEQLLKTLKRCPRFAWPTLILLVTAIGIAGFSTYGFVTGSLPLMLSMLLNVLSAYIAFTVMHEAGHNAVSQIRWVNEWAGRIATAMIFPLPFFQSFRYIHMQHHRFTNEPVEDPDEWAEGDSVWWLPLQWSTIDISYLRCYFKDGVFWTRPRKEQRGFVISTIFMFAFPLTCWYAGVFDVYLLMYFIPARIALFILVWAFDYLPHHGCETTQRENPFRASLNRFGYEWLLTPLLLGQNYHLVHHLYPTVPFYRYQAMWKAGLPVHLEKNSASTDAFGLGPKNGLLPAPL